MYFWLLLQIYPSDWFCAPGSDLRGYQLLLANLHDFYALWNYGVMFCVMYLVDALKQSYLDLCFK